MKQKLIVSILAFLITTILCSQTKITVVIPLKTPSGSSIYIAGDFNKFNPKDNHYQLVRINDSIYNGNFKLPRKGAFKITRGGWETVEKTEDCKELSDRQYNLKLTKSIYCNVKNWSDLCEAPKKIHTAAYNVSVIEHFPMPQLKGARRIWIYLPPDYITSAKRYPVMYMQDGQNLFDAYTAYSEEWGIDETMNDIFSKTGKGIIIVGIDNGPERMQEYSPWFNKIYGGGKGELYAKFIVETLKPYIDSVYRTLPDRINTGVMGSSMGGLISFYIGLKYQQTFSKIGAFSSSFWFNDKVFDLPFQIKETSPMKIYLLAGGNETSNNIMVKKSMKMAHILKKAGYKNEDVLMIVKKDGTHAEWFWRREFADAYHWLFAEYLK